MYVCSTEAFRVRQVFFEDRIQIKLDKVVFLNSLYWEHKFMPESRTLEADNTRSPTKI